MSQAEAEVATSKTSLTQEERRKRVQDARESRVREAFEGKLFDYVGPISYEGDERYTDPTGNKGKHGHELRNVTPGDPGEGDVIVVGDSSLKKAADVYGAVTLPEKAPRGRKTSDDADSNSS